MATKKTPKTNPSWSDVKTKLGDFHRAGLMGHRDLLHHFQNTGHGKACVHAHVHRG